MNNITILYTCSYANIMVDTMFNLYIVSESYIHITACKYEVVDLT